MNEYFGKRGMSVSVEVFIFKISGAYHKQVYLVALEKCDQGALETLCIADVVLREFRKDFPQIVRIALKTDNAGLIFITFYEQYDYNTSIIIYEKQITTRMEFRNPCTP